MPVLTAALLLVISSAAPAGPGPGDALPGSPIVEIRIVRLDVFDTDLEQTSTWPYRTANALHVLTREAFVRSLLLFKVGEPVDPARLAESERLLRATSQSWSMPRAR